MLSGCMFSCMCFSCEMTWSMNAYVELIHGFTALSLNFWTDLLFKMYSITVIYVKNTSIKRKTLSNHVCLCRALRVITTRKQRNVTEPQRWHRRIVFQLFVQTNNCLFKQIVVCLNKQLFVQTNNYLFEQRVIRLNKQLKHYFPMSSLGVRKIIIIIEFFKVA